MLEINKRLKFLRESNNFTSTKIYEYLEITRQTYNCYETGKATPSLKNLIKLADFYNVSLDYLVGRAPSESDTTLTYEQINLINDIDSCNIGLEPRYV